MTIELEVDRLVYALTDASTAEPAASFPSDRNAVALAGLYSWWADDEARLVLGASLQTDLSPLIYAGQAGATTAKAGITRSSTLGSRILRNHLNGNVGSSTFRKTLSAALLEPLGLRLSAPGRLDPGSNALVSDWMRSHLAVATVSSDCSTLAAAEGAVLKRLDPPLNLMGMAPTPVRARLRALRRELRG